MTARPATPADAEELVRLRAVLLRGGPRTHWNDDWREPARQSLTKRLAEADPTLAGFVVDRTGGGLAACALGTIEHRLGNPRDPTGRSGYVFNVATDPDQRRRGFSRACLTALLDWYRARGVTRVDLKASPDGEPLYRSLGFVPTSEPAMRLAL
jgi:ribosomal protein S18 acetylase RimI-like enzyme